MYNDELYFTSQASNMPPSRLLAAPSSQWSPSSTAAASSSCGPAASLVAGAASGVTGPPSPARISLTSAKGFRLHSGQVRGLKRCVSNHFSAEEFDRGRRRRGGDGISGWVAVLCVRADACSVVEVFAHGQYKDGHIVLEAFHAQHALVARRAEHCVRTVHHTTRGPDA